MSDLNIEETNFKNTEPIEGEPLTIEEEIKLTQDKRREEADDRDNDIAEGWVPNE